MLVAKSKKERAALVKELTEKGVTLVTGGVNLPIGMHNATIGENIKAIEFDEGRKAILLQEAFVGKESADFVINPSQLNKYVAGAVISLEVYEHKASGNLRIKVATKKATAPKSIAGNVDEEEED